MSQTTFIKPAHLARLTAILIAVFVLAGCTKGMSDLRSWVAQEKAKKGAPIEPLPVIKTFETFKYDDQDRRDPFSPSTVELERNATTSGP
ncbi:MAG: pilus assembly protein PilP, partial [Pseudomonadota bacterium]|nr:pilus assembly protein PilP [Pseudomonadota bacterium]